MWLHLLVCTTEMCHLGAQVHTLIDRCANNEAAHDPRVGAPPGTGQHPAAAQPAAVHTQLRRARRPDDVHEEGLEKGAPTVQPECKTGLGRGGPQEMREALQEQKQAALCEVQAGLLRDATVLALALARGSSRKGMRNSMTLLGGPLRKSVGTHSETVRGAPRKSMMKLLGGAPRKSLSNLMKLLGWPLGRNIDSH